MRQRIRRFLRMAYEHRELWLQSPVDKHNLRALWYQSDPAWFGKLKPIPMTDEEFEQFQEAMR
jgi:hypothetical protein